MQKLRWGILSTAGIVRKNWRAIHASGSSVVSAVASRELGRSRHLIDACQAETPFEVRPTAFGHYDQLVTSPEVDALYLPLPTGLRKAWVMRGAAAGKHILCEKPCGLSASDLQDMVDACRKHQVQFMDGVMFMHNPRLERVREILDDGQSVGEIKRISSMFSFPANAEFLRANIRIHSELEPTGCLGDLGWYCLRFALWAMHWQLPREVTARILSERRSSLSPAPTPTDFSGELGFDSEVSAGFFCSFLAANQQWVSVSGTRGSVFMPDFVHPRSVEQPAFEVNGVSAEVLASDRPGQPPERSAVAQEIHMFRNFAAQVRSGRLNDEWPRMALLTQQVMDACWVSARNRGMPVTL
jgi:predicted dehydrogenase